MAHLPPLTPNSALALLNDVQGLSPVVQCIGAKSLQGASAQPNQPERYRLAISDGQQWCTGMLATQLNELVRDGGICNNAVLRITQHISSKMQGKKIIIILTVDILGHAPSRIGDPKPLTVEAGPGSGSVQPNGHQAGQQTQQAANPSGGPYNGTYGNPVGNYGKTGANNSYPSAANNNYSAASYDQKPFAQQAAQQHGGNAYGGQQQKPYNNGQMVIAGGYGQAPNFQSNSAVARNDAAPRIVPIASLNAYQNRWTIKARISQRSDMRRWHNARGEGKFFSVDFLDAAGGEIRAVAFNDIADKFDHVLQMGKVVMVSKATLKPKKPGSTFNQTRHDHEMTLEKQTVIEECPPEDEANAIPQIAYRFRKIAEVESCPAQTQVDVVCVVESVGEAGTLTKRDQTETFKRNVVIRDDSNRSIELTLWGGHANNPGDQLSTLVNTQGERPIVAAKSLRVGDFNGKTLSTIGSSLLSINPDLPEAAALKDWYENQGGASMQPTKLSENRGSGRSDRRCVLSAIEDEHLGSNGQAEYISVACTVIMVKSDSAFYPACGLQFNGRPCNKKLTDSSGDGTSWFCERCQQQSQPDWRYILAVQVEDHTNSFWLTAFQEAGTEIMGVTAADLRDMSLSDEKALHNHVMSVVHKPYLLKVKVAEETYNQETRIKKTILRADKFDYIKESRILIDEIGKLRQGQPIMPAQMGAPPAVATANYQGGYQGGAGYAGGNMNGGGAYTPVRGQGGYGQSNNNYGGGYANQGYGVQSYGMGGGGGFTPGRF